MSSKTRFALNHIAAPGLGIDAFFALAHSLGLEEVEIRNDLAGVPIFDGTPAETVRRAAQSQGVRILSINALQRFNEWNERRAVEARELTNYARDCGAHALVLVPVNDAQFRPDDEARLGGLREALAALAPMLDAAGIMGLVEPLGFGISSLRSKREALAAIDAVDAAEIFRLVHDSFHHHLAGEAEIFPERTGLVHISGVEGPGLAVTDMLDAHRVLVGPADRLGNLGQIAALRAGGYSGAFSFEPFAESVQRSRDIGAELAASMRFIVDRLPA